MSERPLATSAASYHQRTKHQFQRFAAGPDTLDWDAQPSPYRTWLGAPLTPLPLVADALTSTWGQTQVLPVGVAPHPLNLRSLACLLELSFALTAWKQFGPDRWALRANPSSGNLHPTEAYVLARGIEGLEDGLYHYEPLRHALACRARYAPDAVADKGLWIGLSSIQWREAWKYGERAFRYCQLDAGHALGALRYAAASLGWQARRIPGLTHDRLAACMGLDRDADFGPAEREEPEMLIAVGPTAEPARQTTPLAMADWFGQASRLDPRPMYKWPVIDEVAQATRLLAAPDVDEADRRQPRLAAVAELCASQAAVRHEAPMASLIRGRRSAQHFDRRAQMTRASFEGMAQALVPVNMVPWDAWPHAPRVHPIFYVHRVEGLEPGVYVLPRSADGEALLRQEIKAASTWTLAWNALLDERDGHWPLWRIASHPTLAGVLRQLSCHQAIASDACWAMSLVAEFEAPLAGRPDAYRLLLQEAGLIGQALYLNAEAQGYRGTGIGCYFDDAVHHLLSLEGTGLQVLYHFTVGVPLPDSRVTTEPPYAHLTPSRQEDAA
jgi:SagB-type dehydrogenase family enzyme